ncbi:MAG: phosphohydrolase [Euryarchaeota archaeon]|nr:phosphohydrolase [Euryarchaeota archaeon]
MREDLMTYLGLKDVLRQGWVNAGVESPESVAAHSWGMAVLALKLCPEGLNLEHVLKLCLVHDLPEVIVGDLTPQDDVSTKSADERAAMEQLAPEWVSLFDEYEGQTTPEAVFVKSLDKLDMALQAKVYMNRSDLDLEQFIESARKTLGDHELLR